MTGPKNRVAYIVTSYPSVTQTFVMRELLELERSGFHLKIFCLRQPTSSIEHPEAHALRAPVIHIPGTREGLPLLLLTHIYCLALNPLRYLRTIRYVVSKNNANFWEAFLRAGFVVAKLRHTGIHHLHAHFAASQTLIAMLVSSLTGIPYSFTAHAYDIFLEQQGLTEKIRSAKFIVTISEFNRKYLTHYCTDEKVSKIHIVHCGIDLEQFALTRARRRQRSLNKSFTILTVASLGEKKGHIYLLQALSLLKEKGRIFHWIVAGDGPQRSLLEEGVRARDLTDQVTFAGEVASGKVLELLERADVFVLPCVRAENGDMDGIPVALMEAMAAGVPAISTTMSGIPELIDHRKNGLLVKPKDIGGLAEAIEYLLDHPEQGERLGAAAPDKIAQHFELKKNVWKLAALFHS